jgi:hypothetical protein
MSELRTVHPTTSNGPMSLHEIPRIFGGVRVFNDFDELCSMNNKADLWNNHTDLWNNLT